MIPEKKFESDEHPRRVVEREERDDDSGKKFRSLVRRWRGCF